jgi:hypothetical protein
MKHSINNGWKLKLPLLIIALCSGCASITGSKNQPVSVTAVHQDKQVDGAECSLTNDKGTWFVKSPGSTVIQKSGADLVITCNKEGLPTGSTSAKSSANGGVWGNILFGGIIGYAIDASTGAGFDYPTSLGVQMGQVIQLQPQTPPTDSAGQQSSMPAN